MARWTTQDIPPQYGRTAVVTGTGGLGYEDALALTRAGCEVIVAGRDPRKGADAVRRIRSEVSPAKVSFEQLDLASLASVSAFAERVGKQHSKLDLLINNAGVMVPPQRQLTSDGFELQLGTNYLGHFALTAYLLPLLLKGEDPRVISLSSVAARDGVINFEDLNSEHGYKAMPVYSQSKLACLMFAIELQRRSDAASWGISSIAAHPGISRTDLLHNGPGRWSVHSMLRSALPFLFQPAAQGALPTLFAATSPKAKGGAYYGPDKMSEVRGFPAPAKIPSQALDKTASARLWQISQVLTDVDFGSEAISPAGSRGQAAGPRLAAV